MGFYNDSVVPRLVTCACGTKPILKQREKVVPMASGRVLEIGLGAGHNLPYYHATQVESVVGIDPCVTSWKLAQPRAASLGVPLEFIEGSAEAMPLPDSAFDSVLMTYSLCTIPDAHTALAEIRRVLKPGGRLLFCEHGIAPDPGTSKWQARINPLWRRLMGGCNLNRPIVAWIEQAGFSMKALDQMYLPGTPRIAGFNVWGVAEH
ncbi:MAG: class I SAM-dependent methyltransferase [Luminiphilus sp.]|nr:class I SAM-dependent methyltransferase [Luminiphilus sp.]MBL6820542.1 class I SAM-dependent methyltransferase [Luminiphilus sp.]